MKNLKIMMFALLSVACVALTGCGKDDDNGNEANKTEQGENQNAKITDFQMTDEGNTVTATFKTEYDGKPVDVRIVALFDNDDLLIESRYEVTFATEADAKAVYDKMMKPSKGGVRLDGRTIIVTEEADATEAVSKREYISGLQQIKDAGFDINFGGINNGGDNNDEGDDDAQGVVETDNAITVTWQEAFTTVATYKYVFEFADDVCVKATFSAIYPSEEVAQGMYDAFKENYTGITVQDKSIVIDVSNHYAGLPKERIRVAAQRLMNSGFPQPDVVPDEDDDVSYGDLPTEPAIYSGDLLADDNYTSGSARLMLVPMDEQTSSSDLRYSYVLDIQVHRFNATSSDEQTDVHHIEGTASFDADNASGYSLMVSEITGPLAGSQGLGITFDYDVNDVTFTVYIEAIGMSGMEFSLYNADAE